jgi:hypothetical protein
MTIVEWLEAVFVILIILVIAYRAALARQRRAWGVDLMNPERLVPSTDPLRPFYTVLGMVAGLSGGALLVKGSPMTAIDLASIVLCAVIVLLVIVRQATAIYIDRKTDRELDERQRRYSEMLARRRAQEEADRDGGPTNSTECFLCGVDDGKTSPISLTIDGTDQDKWVHQDCLDRAVERSVSPPREPEGDEGAHQ